MKKTISFILSVLLACLCFTTAFAGECSHSYTEKPVEASCIEKAHTLYTCSLCGDTYKRYADDPVLPDSFYVLAKSERVGNTLNISVSLENNPGFFGARLYLKYDASVLTVNSVEKGALLASNDFFSVNLEKNPLSIYAESPLSSSQSPGNTANGTFFTASFTVTDPDAPYGISIYYTKNGDFVGLDFSDSGVPKIIKHNPEIINIIGLSELGDHSYVTTTVPPTCTEEGYTSTVCSVCSDTVISDRVPATGHSLSLEQTITPSDFENEGEGLYRCSACGHEEILPIPVLERWAKGDLDNDGKITAKDANILARVIMGLISSPQHLDAADCVVDGMVNAKDLVYIKLVLISL